MCTHVRPIRRVTWYFDLKQCPRGRLIGDCDGAAVQIDKILRDCKTEPRATKFSRGAVLCLTEALENRAAHVRIYTGPAVLDTEQHADLTDGFERASNPAA